MQSCAIYLMNPMFAEPTSQTNTRPMGNTDKHKWAKPCAWTCFYKCPPITSYWQYPCFQWHEPSKMQCSITSVPIWLYAHLLQIIDTRQHYSNDLYSAGVPWKLNILGKYKYNTQISGHITRTTESFTIQSSMCIVNTDTAILSIQTTDYWLYCLFAFGKVGWLSGVAKDPDLDEDFFPGLKQWAIWDTFK